MAQLGCGDVGRNAACDARGGDLMVVPRDADGRGLFEPGPVVLLVQHTVEAGFEESWSSARANAKGGGFSFLSGVSCRRHGQDVVCGAGGGRIAETVGRIARRQAAWRSDPATVRAVYEGEI